MLLMFVRPAEIFLWILIKRFLAAGGTEVIGLPLVFGRASRGRGVNIHSTNGVVYCICHINHLLLFNRIIALSRRVQGEQNYSKKHAHFRLFVAGNTLSIRAAAALTGCLLKHTLSLQFLMDHAGPGRR